MMGARKPKGINIISIIGYCYLSPREENLSFSNNYMIEEL